MMSAFARSLACSALLLALGCESPGMVSNDAPDLGKSVDYLTVNEVHDQRAMLNGQRVRVRGWGRLTISTTKQGCMPKRCDCNTSSGSLAISNRQKVDVFQDYQLIVQQLTCAGDECNATCRPFDPAARGYELSGTFKLGENDKLTLEQLDLPGSSQLAGAGELDTLIENPLILGDILVPVVR